MDGIKNLLSSEHGVFGVLLIVGATTLCGLKIMTIDDWKSFAQVIFGTFAIAHVGVSAANAFKRPEVARIEAAAKAQAQAPQAPQAQTKEPS